MISKDTVESRVANIRKQLDSFKSTQPFYNGQWRERIVTTSQQYDYSFKFNDNNTSPNFRVEFTADIQAPPMATCYPVCFDASNNVLNAYQVNVLEATDSSSGYSNGKKVTFRFYSGVDSSMLNTTIYVKIYIISTDTGTITVTRI